MLERLEKVQKERIESDLQWVKDEYLNGAEFLNKTASSVVPGQVRHSSAINTPINFIADKLFKTGNVIDPDSDRGKASRIRNIALGIAEGLASYAIMKAVRKNL